MRTEEQDGIQYRILDFEGAIPGGEGIEFLYAEKAWSMEYRFGAAVRIFYTLDSVRQENAFVLEVSQRVFIYELLWEFWEQPARMAFLAASVEPIINFLFEASFWQGQLEGIPGL